MESSSFVILGSNGQLGKALQRKYPEARALDSDELDISNSEQVESYDWSGISTIINAAAYTNVDGAETPEGAKLAKKVNADGVANLASIAIRNSITLVHISSDYVFDGKQKIHTEDEEPKPLSVYGETKAAGDKEAASVDSHYIVRTSWVIGEGRNFVQIMLGANGWDKEPKVVEDQIGRLTFTSELVRAIDHLLSAKAPYGTYNVSNDGEPASWADITREIFKKVGYDIPVHGVTTKEYYSDKPGAAERPLESTLSLYKIHQTGFVSHDWKEDLEHYINAVQGVKA